MKNYKLICFITLLFSSAHSQNKRFIADYNPCKEMFDVDTSNATDHVCHNYVNNRSTGQLKLIWKRYDAMLPDGWEPSVCDNIQCWATFVKESPEDMINIIPDLKLGNRMLADVHMYDSGQLGSGAQIFLKVYEKEDTSSFISIEYLFNKESIGTQNIQRNIKIKMYPNPAQEKFYIEYNAGVSRIEIYNLMGIKFQTYKTEPSRTYDISELEEGIYFIKFISDENKIIRTSKLLKSH